MARSGRIVLLGHRYAVGGPHSTSDDELREMPEDTSLGDCLLAVDSDGQLRPSGEEDTTDLGSVLAMTLKPEGSRKERRRPRR